MHVHNSVRNKPKDYRKEKVNKLFFFAKNVLLDKEDYKSDPLMVTINHLFVQASS